MQKLVVERRSLDLAGLKQEHPAVETAERLAVEAGRADSLGLALRA